MTSGETMGNRGGKYLEEMKRVKEVQLAKEAASSIHLHVEYQCHTVGCGG